MLRTVNTLKQRFLPLPPLFAATIRILDRLQKSPLATIVTDGVNSAEETFLNMSHEVAAHAGNVSYILEFATRVHTQILDTLNLSNQGIAIQHQSVSVMQQDVAVKQSQQVYHLAKAGAQDSVAIRVCDLQILVFPVLYFGHLWKVRPSRLLTFVLLHRSSPS